MNVVSAVVEAAAASQLEEEVRLRVRTLFVSGLPMDIKPRELYLLFRPFKGYEGSLIKLTSKQPVGFVMFDSRSEAETAKNSLSVSPSSSSTCPSPGPEPHLDLTWFRVSPGSDSHLVQSLTWFRVSPGSGSHLVQGLTWFRTSPGILTIESFFFKSGPPYIHQKTNVHWAYLLR
ncbi:uncharacterized protein LOC133361901 isoform X2 [Lethenteron reissneri]|uniref:uncharacterized protein LOC133361901 isoform X2 n=1 Tax=Lethenteron reissneri TaxID=7753 RepID=UPI002AB69765|nr:uncharacterized protein LOC133361901 isoform X2 [Lethenteron reissneri]